MKKYLSVLLVSAICLPAAAYAQGTKIATVDMNRAFKEYNKTKDAEVKINEAKNAAKKEYDDRADSYKKALDEINKINQHNYKKRLSLNKNETVSFLYSQKITIRLLKIYFTID